jgi:hypothetical protein
MAYAATRRGSAPPTASQYASNCTFSSRSMCTAAVTPVHSETNESSAFRTSVARCMRVISLRR